MLCLFWAGEKRQRIYVPEVFMYFNTESYLAKEQSDELSSFLGSLTFQINSYGKWISREILRANYMSSDFEIIYYCMGGSGTTIEGRDYECEPGSLLILEPFQLVTSVNDGYAEISYYYIHFDIEPLYLQKKFRDLILKNGPVLHRYEIGNMRDVFEDMFLEKMSHKIGYLSILHTGLLRVAVEIMRAQNIRTQVLRDQYAYTRKNCTESPTEDIRPDSGQIDTVRLAIDYIRETLDRPFRMEEAERALNVSGSYLYKAFIGVLGTAPGRFAMQIKMKEAKVYLRQREGSIEEIGEKLGFSSPNHFSNTFKKLVGMSPKQYRGMLG